MSGYGTLLLREKDELPSDAQWDCPACTLLNPISSKECSMCGGPRPQEAVETLRTLKRQETERTLERQREEAEERRKAMMLKTDDTWDDEDFGADEDFDAPVTGTEEDIKAEEDGDDGDWGEDDGGWGDIGDEGDWGDSTMVGHYATTDIKEPEMKPRSEVMTMHKLQDMQAEVVKEIQELLFLDSAAETAAICRHFRWNQAQIVEEYPVKADELRAKIGLFSQSPTTPDTVSEEQLCFLCVETRPKSEMFFMDCGHSYCTTCWTAYLNTAMQKGKKVIYTKCIEPACKLLVPPSAFTRFLPYKWREKYQEYLINSFVEGRKDLKWCPGKDCSHAARAEFASTESIFCFCSHVWCFNCRMMAHKPCDCDTTAEWYMLCSDEAESITWVRAFTQQCAKCGDHIEKNQGCNHMTCRCGYEFCWLCRKEWNKIGGYGHTCNKPPEVEAEEKEQAKAESHLKRYMFYYSRYEAHEKSLGLAYKSLENAETCVRQFMAERPDMKLHDFMFITDAANEIIMTKRVLQWSYAYGYYLKNNTIEKDLFETQQGLLERFSDELHEKCEQRVDSESRRYELLDIAVRQDLLNLTSTVEKYRQNFSEAVEASDFPLEPGIKGKKPGAVGK